MPSSKEILALMRRLAAIHRELGIPANYSVDRHLAPHVEAVAAQLVEVGINDEGRPVLLLQPAAEAWASMRQAAARNDLELIPISGFRSIARQTEIVREKLAAGQPLDDILTYVAAPGFSEHHTGRALDIATTEHIELNEEFERTAAFHWLEEYARQFGFTLSYPRKNPHRIGYEPWHWCWNKQ
jgi:D-alanyl-D-alanine carboxypeptidase